MKYAFKHPLKRALASAFDAAGRALFRHKKRPRPRPIRSLLVIRVDQIGDAVFTEPFLRAARARLAGTRLTLLASPAAKELYGDSPVADEVVAFDAPWFRDAKGPLAALRAFWSLRRLIGSLRPDAVVDLRGDLRHILAAAWGAPAAWRAGYGVTGGGFLLDAEPAYDGRAHAAERNLKILEVLDPAAPLQRGPLEIRTRLGDAPIPDELKSLLPPKERAWVALHAGAGTRSKEWPDGHWVRLARGLAAWDAEFFWIGDAAAQEKTRRILVGLADVRGRFADLTNRLPLGSLGTFFDSCDFLVSGDSGPVHVASSRKLKTLVLFSGANELHPWKPLSGEAEIMYHEVACSPCHQRVCPLARHDCMEDLEPDAVLKEADRLVHAKHRV